MLPTAVRAGQHCIGSNDFVLVKVNTRYRTFPFNPKVSFHLMPTRRTNNAVRSHGYFQIAFYRRAKRRMELMVLAYGSLTTMDKILYVLATPARGNRYRPVSNKAGLATVLDFDVDSWLQNLVCHDYGARN
jgi:hypothetical protein